MSTVAGSDYGDDRSSRHRSRTSKHKSSRSKHRRREESDDDSDTPVEVVQEENQYYDPVTGTSTREYTKTEYKRSSSRRHRSRRDRDLSEDDDNNLDGVRTVAEADAAESVASSKSRRHRSRRDKDRSERGSEYSPPSQPEYPGSRAGSVVAPAAIVATSRDRDRESGYASRSPSPAQSARSSRRERRKSMGEAALGAVGLGAVADKYREGKEGRSRSSSPAESTRSSRRAPSSKRDRRKSVGETALAALGLGAAADAFKNDKRSKSRHRERRSVYSESESDGEYERSRSGRSRGGSKAKENSAQAAILAAAVEAFRSRKEPGGATGTKGLKRIIEAAVGAGGIELFLGRNGRDEGKPSTKHIMESVIGGLGIQRVANGPRANSGESTGKDLAASAVIALAGNALLDKLRARSQSPEDRRRSSRSSRSSRPGMGDRKRSQSVGNLLTAGGLGTAAYELGKNRRDRDVGSDDEDNESNISPSDTGSKKSRRSRRDRNAELDPEVNPVPISQRVRRDYDIVGYTPDGQLALAETTTELAPGSRGAGDRSMLPWKGDDSDSEDIPDSDDEQKKMHDVRRRQWLGIALAVVGSLDLMSRLYETKEKRAKAKEDVASGRISQEQANKSNVKGRLKNLVVFGLLILGIKEAFDGWKEVMEKRKEYKEVCQEYTEHHKKRMAKQQRGGPVVHQYIMPPAGMPGALATVPPAGTYPGYNATYGSVDGGVAGGAYSPPQQYVSSAQSARELGYSGYTTRDGRPLPVVYPDDVIHA